MADSLVALIPIPGVVELVIGSPSKILPLLLETQTSTTPSIAT